METERPTAQPGDGGPGHADPPEVGDLRPRETTQDPVEAPDAGREPGHTKS